MCRNNFFIFLLVVGVFKAQMAHPADDVAVAGAMPSKEICRLIADAAIAKYNLPAKSSEWYVLFRDEIAAKAVADALNQYQRSFNQLDLDKIKFVPGNPILNLEEDIKERVLAVKAIYERKECQTGDTKYTFPDHIASRNDAICISPDKLRIINLKEGYYTRFSDGTRCKKGETEEIDNFYENGNYKNTHTLACFRPLDESAKPKDYLTVNLSHSRDPDRDGHLQVCSNGICGSVPARPDPNNHSLVKWESVYGDRSRYLNPTEYVRSMQTIKGCVPEYLSSRGTQVDGDSRSALRPSSEEEAVVSIPESSHAPKGSKRTI